MDEDQYFDWVRNSCPDEEYFMQEYMCTPSNDETAFISYELLNKCRIGGHVENESHVKIEDKKLGKKGITYWVSNDPIGPGPLYLGVDIGRHKDLTVMWLAEKVAGRLITRKVAFLNRVPFRRQEVILRVEFLDLKNLIRACIDQTGIGEQMAENAQADYGYKVECVRFNIEVKITMAFAVRTAMEDGAFLTPDAPRIESSFRKIKKTTTVAGNIRFDGERDKDGHADDFWAGALCKHGEASPNAGYCAPPDVDFDDFEGGSGRSIHPYAGGYRRMV
jgi:phage FluMu gp28-like protein